MIIYIASDHSGYRCKNMLIDYLISREVPYNDTIFDMGHETEESCDYPDYANKLCNSMKNDNSYGILICGTGIGMSIAANRHHHIRCALCYTTSTVEMARLHNNANVLAIGAKYTSDNTIKEMVNTFITTPFSNESRHISRLDKLGP